MLTAHRAPVVLSILALAACAETQAPPSPDAEPSLASSLPVLGSAKADLALTGGSFTIRLRFVSSATDRQRQVFRASAERWQRIIVRDVPSVTGVIPRNFCGDFGTPRFSGTIDDILVDVLLTPIDGPGNVLGAAGPCAIRFADDLPAYGLMFFDSDDLDFLDEFGLLDEVIVHEMGHVLGFGALWTFNRNLVLNAGTRNPRFAGADAVRFWHRRLLGVGRVPLEQDGGPGTAESHWDEETFGHELMTGFLGLGANPLSNLTAHSMRDLGYGVRLEGDPYRRPTAEVTTLRSQGLDLARMERLILPKGAIE
jgi:hypothetical protein